MAHQFLIDECLPPHLAEVAQAAGYHAIHVAYHGLASNSDSALLQRAAADNLIIVSNNRDDFVALIKGVPVHPGLVVLNGSVNLAGRAAQFAAALEALRQIPDALNTVVEVSANLEVSLYQLPT